MPVDSSSLETFIQGALTAVALGFIIGAVRDQLSLNRASLAEQPLPFEQPHPSELVETSIPVPIEMQPARPEARPSESESLVSISRTQNSVAHYIPTLPSRLSSRHFTVPRIGDSPAENCDASDSNDSHQAFAIADGASQSFNSGDWARLIIKDWVNGEPTTDIAVVAERCVPVWHQLSDKALESLPPDSLVREKMAGGSSATFGGLRLIWQGSDLYWQITTVGDVLVVATQRKSDGERYVLRTYPFSIGATIGTGTPHQVSTKPPFLYHTVNTAIERDSPGLEFVMMTDAVARRIFGELTRNTNIRNLLPFLNEDQRAFAEWVDSQRQINALDDDDSTVLNISMHQSVATEAS